MKSFREFQLLATIQDTLAEKGFAQPTEIQSRVMTKLLEGKDLVGVSETGSGKTLAFSLPTLHKIKTLELEKGLIKDLARPRAIILVPTRELGEQVSKVIKPFTHATRARVRTALGGTSMEISRRNVSGAFEILVATPGRLTQLMERKLIDLSDIRTLIFDEADQMLDQGFLPDAKKIATACPEDRQLMLFSATVSKSVQNLITELFGKAEVIRSRGSHRVVPNLKTKNKTILNGDRLAALEPLLKESVEGGTIIFANTREQCDKLHIGISKAGFKSVLYRGEMDKVVRRMNLKSFRDGEVKILISTDLASRGLDVEHIGRVINYHMPKHIENYIHRVGRTARAGRSGVVINFITERDQEILTQLESIKSLEKAAESSRN